MPKKNSNRALLTKPSSSARSNLSLSSASSSSNHGAQSKPTVNDLLREARKPKGHVKQEQNVGSPSSLHPTVREVLNMPSPAPLPRCAHLSGPVRLRRIPGPPPPASWLEHSTHASDEQRMTLAKLRMIRSRIQQPSSTLPGLTHFPPVASLEHLVYTKIAIRWQWHVYHDHIYLSTLPVISRMTLLSYIALYHDPISTNPFPVLFPPECESEELDTVTRLDLSNSLGGSWATVRKIEKELVTVKRATNAQGKEKEKAQEVIPESWDDDETDTAGFKMPTSIASPMRFPNLKHLSLAFNPASSGAPPSWASLISLTSQLPGLTSLSLAHWPTPTYTPNAAKGRVKIVDNLGSSGPSQVFGGTDIYTAYDNNWREAAGILRTLSRNLYCLTWLDLTGCVSWLSALTWTDGKGKEMGADWTGSWRTLETLIFAVGWLPGLPPDSDEELLSTRSSSSIDSARAIEQLYGGHKAIQESLEAIANLRLGASSGIRPPRVPEADPPVWSSLEARQKQRFRVDVERFYAQQTMAKMIAEEIKTIRRSAPGTKRIEFDFGKSMDKQLLDGD